VALRERERRLTGLVHVLGVLAADEAELRLLPGEAAEVASGEELARIQTSGQMKDRGALHDRVVDVEERGSRRVERHAKGILDLGCGC
jgi:hypothetical protein